MKSETYENRIMTNVLMKNHIYDKHIITFVITSHSSMPSPLAPDPIRVQSCVWCHSEPIKIAWW